MKPGVKRFIFREALPSFSTGLLASAVVVIALRGGVSCKPAPPTTSNDVKNEASCFVEQYLKGATPAQMAIACGEQEVSVAVDVIRMLDRRLDAGKDGDGDSNGDR